MSKKNIHQGNQGSKDTSATASASTPVKFRKGTGTLVKPKPDDKYHSYKKHFSAICRQTYSARCDLDTV